MGKYIYKTETHLHCSETSNCSSVSAAEYVHRFKEAGYTTIFVSDHYYRKRFKDCETEEQYRVAIDSQLKGYRTAKAEGDRVGLTVLLACEFHIEDDDYLFLGIDESFFYHKEIGTMTPEELFAFCNEHGYTLFAAHPFRDGCTPKVHAVHGFELINTSYNHYADNHNEKALELAKTHPHLLTTGGSDAHTLNDVGTGGIMTEEPVRSVDDYLRILRSGNYEIINNKPEGR